jgi:hypothetical protein
LSSKLLEFLGLSDRSDEGNVVVESHRRSHAEYMKKMKHLVVQSKGEDAHSPVSGPKRSNEPYEAVKDDPLTEEMPRTETQMEQETAYEPEQEQKMEQQEPAPLFERPSQRSGNGRLRTRRSESRHSGPSFTDKIRSFGQSLRRPEENQQPLVLIKSGAADMIEDIENALVGGQTVLLDFERENPDTAKDVISKVVGFVRMHNGVYYTVTSTSLLLALNGNAVIEWRPEPAEPQER